MVSSKQTKFDQIRHAYNVLSWPVTNSSLICPSADHAGLSLIRAERGDGDRVIVLILPTFPVVDASAASVRALRVGSISAFFHHTFIAMTPRA
jgi:hypothetical protein